MRNRGPLRTFREVAALPATHTVPSKARVTNFISKLSQLVGDTVLG
jgi:hypothetical protein